MTGPEHYRAAENLIRAVKDGHSEGTDVANIVAAAQVHATLALAAATADQLADRYVGDGNHIAKWRTATGTAGDLA